MSATPEKNKRKSNDPALPVSSSDIIELVGNLLEIHRWQGLLLEKLTRAVGDSPPLDPKPPHQPDQ